MLGNWEDFLVSELVPFIDKTYRTIPKAQVRGLMGHSAGGYGALMLASLHPNVWGSIGLNDPASWMMWYPLNDGIAFEGNFTKVDTLAIKGSTLRLKFSGIPDNLEGYDSLPEIAKWLLQKGASFSPNPNSPILCDMPVTADKNQLVQEIWAKWSNYDLSEPKGPTKYLEALRSLSSIAIIVPDSLYAYSFRISNISFIDYLKTAGISITRLDMPGNHNSDQSGRFIALAQNLLKAMK